MTHQQEFFANARLSEPEVIVPVLVPVAVASAYSYKVPAGMNVRPGSIVRVPLGSREVIGAVWDGEPDTAVNPKKLKSILHVYDSPPIADDLRKYIDWVAAWTLGAPGMVLRMVLRSEEGLEPEALLSGVRYREGKEPDRMTAARERVLEHVRNGMAWTRPGLAGVAGVSSSVIDGLKKQGVLEEVMLPSTPPLPHPDPTLPGRKLTELQQGAANQLCEGIGKGFKAFLIDGVTGSGKTEVYFEAVAEALKNNEQALVLIPEIALTSQFLERFEQRFGVRPAEWHSQVSPKRRARTWRGVANGEVKVVVGARSALFLPFHRLGLLVVDEEHDTAYKQDDRVPYNARDMAVVRGHISGFPVVLASATPSVESQVNAKLGRYQRIVLPERATGAEMPIIKGIDMRCDGPERGKWLAPAMVNEIQQTLSDGKQVLLFLNRRGYAPLTLCRTCGHRFHCENCSAWLVEHRFRGKLCCHHCGYSQPIPDKCPECSKPDSLVACGPGVERIAEDASALFPDAKVLVLSSDLPGGTERINREMKLVETGEVDIVIGTQLVAKGHNFPLMTLVGVVDADLGLANGDPRAAERTFQLLAQVTGRAGRIHGKGRGLLQTYNPDQPVIRALLSGNPEEFYAAEIESRENAGLPPFGRLAALIISGPDRVLTEKYSKSVAINSPGSEGVQVLGPAEAAMAQVRGRYRFRLLAIAPRTIDLQGFLRKWLSIAPKPTGGIRVQVDVDPQSFM
ncbi:primosomal protein N' [Pseudovibrio sp. Tun.PSC04-5.I4]|uniref:primosomal protein N' n=1 Tax=Pseudovibrio sp. Tun.PSC04-5.I4 TaxID=1798213 RepID=UPI00190EAAFC|nr:primosomal protein N' [Pseudovibrio sp. Tun.PSC04-5.I4]